MAKAPTTQKAVRQAQSAPLAPDLEAYMREQCVKLSRGHDLAKAMNYIFKRWSSFTRFLDDGRVCLSRTTPPKARCAASHWAESRG
jgi:transposase